VSGRRAGLGGYESGFLEQLLLPALYPAALTRELQWALGLGALALNALVYAFAMRSRRRSRPRRQPRLASARLPADNARRSTCGPALRAAQTEGEGDGRQPDDAAATPRPAPAQPGGGPSRR
jgi:hypothetical protein